MKIDLNHNFHLLKERYVCVSERVCVTVFIWVSVRVHVFVNLFVFVYVSCERLHVLRNS